MPSSVWPGRLIVKENPFWRESQMPKKLSPGNRSEAYPRVSSCMDIRIAQPEAAVSLLPLSEGRN